MKLPDYYRDIGGRTASWDNDDAASEPQCDLGGLVTAAAELRRLPKRGGLLEIGCQGGGLLQALSQDFKELTGVDIGDYSRYWQAVPHATFIVHDVDSAPLPFADCSFDAVACLMVMEHVFDVFNLASEIARVLKPGGYAVVEVPNAGYVKHLWSLLRGRVPRTAEQIWPFEPKEGWDAQHLHLFTITELQILLGGYGFRRVRAVSRGRLGGLRRLWPSLLFA